MAWTRSTASRPTATASATATSTSRPWRPSRAPRIVGSVPSGWCVGDAALRRDPARPRRRRELEQKVRLLTGADFWALHPEPAVGLRRMVASDGPAGVRGERWDERDPRPTCPRPPRSPPPGTRPRSSASAGCWPPRRGARASTSCSRRRSTCTARPFGGRHFECFSEDPLLTARHRRGLRARAAGRGRRRDGQALRRQRLRDRAVHARRPGRRARRCASCTWRRSRRSSRDAGAWAVMAAYNGVNGPTMTESPLLRDVLKDEWGFDGVVMSDWFAGRSTEAAAQRRARPGHARPDRPVGRRAGRGGARRARAARPRSTTRSLRLLRLAARVGALDGVEPAAPPGPRAWAGRARSAAELRATAAGRLRAGRATRARSCRSTRAALRRVAVIGPQRRVGTDAGRRQRHGLPAVHGLPAGRPAGRARRRTSTVDARARRAQPTRARRRGRRPTLLTADAASRSASSAADGAVLAAERRAGGTFIWLGPTPRRADDAVAAVEVHARLRAAEAGAYSSAASGVGPLSPHVDGAAGFDDACSSCPPGADLVEGMMRPPQRGAPVELARRRGGRRRAAPRPSAAGRTSRRAAVPSFQLNVEPPHGSDDEELAPRRRRSRPRRRRRRGRRRHHRGGRERGLRPRRRWRCPAARTSSSRRVAAANPRTVVVVNSGAPVLLPWADEVPAVLLTWFPGQEFGNALADVLLGAAEPGGRLPTTWPRRETGLPVAHSRSTACSPTTRGCSSATAPTSATARRRCTPSATAWATRSWEYASTLDVGDGPGEVRVTRAQHGRPGAAARWCRCTRRGPDSAVERPARWLAGFAAVEAAPARRSVTAAGPALTGPWRTGTWPGGAWSWSRARSVLQAGRSAQDLRLRAELVTRAASAG